MKEIAAVTGSQSDFDEAKHRSVVLRELPEDRPYAAGQAFIPLATLSEHPVEGTACHAIQLFSLTDDERKLKWLRRSVNSRSTTKVLSDILQLRQAPSILHFTPPR